MLDTAEYTSTIVSAMATSKSKTSDEVMTEESVIKYLNEILSVYINELSPPVTPYENETFFFEKDDGLTRKDSKIFNIHYSNEGRRRQSQRTTKKRTESKRNNLDSRHDVDESNYRIQSSSIESKGKINKLDSIHDKDDHRFQFSDVLGAKTKTHDKQDYRFNNNNEFRYDYDLDYRLKNNPESRKSDRYDKKLSQTDDHIATNDKCSSTMRHDSKRAENQTKTNVTRIREESMKFRRIASIPLDELSRDSSRESIPQPTPRYSKKKKNIDSPKITIHDTNQKVEKIDSQGLLIKDNNRITTKRTVVPSQSSPLIGNNNKGRTQSLIIEQHSGRGPAEKPRNNKPMRTRSTSNRESSNKEFTVSLYKTTTTLGDGKSGVTGRTKLVCTMQVS